MKNPGKRWSVRDRGGNLIYLTQERWNHIIDENNHSEMLAYVVIILFGYDIDKDGQTIPNNYVATAFFKHMRLKS